MKEEGWNEQDMLFLCYRAIEDAVGGLLSPEAGKKVLEMVKPYLKTCPDCGKLFTKDGAHYAGEGCDDGLF